MPELIQTKTILLIEDNVDDEQMLIRALQKNNIMNEVVVACDGEEAIRLLFPEEGGRSPINPDLIILDLHLPGISGLHVLEKLRANCRTRYTPVVGVSSNWSVDQSAAVYEAGANSFVVKPTDANEFSETFLHLALYWLLVNVNPNRPAYQ